MTEEERKNEFLRLFKNLEQKLISYCKPSGEGYLSFSKALNQVYYDHKDPIVSSWDNYDFLKTANELRNRLSHENDICSPSEAFLFRFSRLVRSIVSPSMASDVRTKNRISCTRKSRVKDLRDIRNKGRVSHVPILDRDKCCIGVFSRSSLFDYLSLHPDAGDFSSLSMEDRKETVSLLGHRNEKFLFVPSSARADKLFPLLNKAKAHDKNVGLLLVTKNGKHDEKLLGVLSVTDLAKIQQ